MDHNMEYAAGGDYVALDVNLKWDFSTTYSLKIGTTTREFTVRCAEQNIIPIWATRQPAEDGGDYPYEDDLHKINGESIFIIFSKVVKPVPVKPSYSIQFC